MYVSSVVPVGNVAAIAPALLSAAPPAVSAADVSVTEAPESVVCVLDLYKGVLPFVSLNCSPLPPIATELATAFVMPTPRLPVTESESTRMRAGEPMLHAQKDGAAMHSNKSRMKWSRILCGVCGEKNVCLY